MFQPTKSDEIFLKVGTPNEMFVFVRGQCPNKN